MYKLSFKSKIPPKTFKIFLLKLKPITLAKFTKFRKITPKTVEHIIEKEVMDSNIIKFFSFVNDELIAYSFLTKFVKPSKKHNCVLGIVVSDSWQKQGFGKKICQHMIETAWNKNFEKIWLTVYSDNIDAYKMYKDLGFEIEGIFLHDEKIRGKSKHKISMAIFKKNSNNKSKRKLILNTINEKKS